MVGCPSGIQYQPGYPTPVTDIWWSSLNTYSNFSHEALPLPPSVLTTSGGQKSLWSHSAIWIILGLWGHSLDLGYTLTSWSNCKSCSNHLYWSHLVYWLHHWSWSQLSTLNLDWTWDLGHTFNLGHIWSPGGAVGVGHTTSLVHTLDTCPTLDDNHTTDFGQS